MIRLASWLRSFLPERCDMPECRGLGVHLVKGLLLCDDCWDRWRAA